MKQILQNLKTGKMELLELPCLKVGRGQVLIQTRASLISAGTERMLVEFSQANLIQKARQQPDKVKQVLDKMKTDGLMPTLEAVFRKLDEPMPLGYCNAGVVLEVGEDIHDIQPGDRVASNGPHAEVVCVPRNLCAKIPDVVTDEQAAFTVLGSKARVAIAPNLPPVINVADGSVAVKEKAKGCLKIIFLSRISRKKNLNGALKMLKGLNGNVQFNIYGPMEDKSYWAECQKIISGLPENIKVQYCGSMEHDKVSAVMKDHDIFFFPTLGENFGHVILEALCAGCPILISDQTPWRNLEEKGVGWDLSLSKPGMFQEVLQRCVEMDNDEYVKWSERARKYGLGVTRDDKVVEQNRRLFYKVTSM